VRLSTLWRGPTSRMGNGGRLREASAEHTLTRTPTREHAQTDLAGPPTAGSPGTVFGDPERPLTSSGAQGDSNP
jgi:hypothetical protein